MDENNQAVNMADHVLGFDPEQVERLPFAICAARRPLVRLPAATRRSPTATFIKVFR